MTRLYYSAAVIIYSFAIITLGAYTWPISQ